MLPVTCVLSQSHEAADPNLLQVLIIAIAVWIMAAIPVGLNSTSQPLLNHGTVFMASKY